MGVPLWRAWEICRLLDEADAERCDQDIERAVTLSAPTSGTGKTGHAGMTRAAIADSIGSKLDPDAAERVRQRRRRRLAL